VQACHVMPPATLERHDANRIGGDIKGGAALAAGRIEPLPGHAAPKKPSP